MFEHKSSQVSGDPTRGDEGATSDRLRRQPTPGALRDDLEDALFEVAAQAVNAMVKLREQRSAQTVDPDAVTGHVRDGAAALRLAEVTAAALAVALPRQGI